MVHRVLVLHWRKYLRGKLIREIYSFHLDEKEKDAFVEQNKERLKKRPEFHYSPGLITFGKVPSKLTARVSHSKNGIWGRKPKPIG